MVTTSLLIITERVCLAYKTSPLTSLYQWVVRGVQFATHHYIILKRIPAHIKMADPDMQNKPDT